MKKDQVPQDDEHLMEGRTREVCYAVDDKGHYVQVLSPGWEPKNAALKQAWEQIGEEAKEAFMQVKAGKVSPLAFYMAKGMFDLALLSAYTDIPKRKIKDHLDPETFRRLDTETLARYAEAFAVSVDELRQGPATDTALPGDK
jgi:phosphoribosyl-ATP pyrophosphohydrolase